MIDSKSQVSIVRQCELLNVCRATHYYKPLPPVRDDAALRRRIDELFTERPFLGSRGMRRALRREGIWCNRKRLQRLMRVMGLESVAPKPNTSAPRKDHEVFPYLLRGLTIDGPNQVWATDITYIPMRRGHLYLVAVIDWWSRKVLSWRLSNSLDSRFCVEALDEALVKFGCPAVFNTDQGAQFTSAAFLSVLKQNQIQISMDGRGRALDNVFVERLWRSVKYEHVYLHPYNDGHEVEAGLRTYFAYYNAERGHSSLNDHTPDEMYYGVTPMKRAA
jgi:putative transposase